MTQVTQDAFFAVIMNHTANIHPTIVTGYPYTSEWRIQDTARRMIGKTVDRYANPPAGYPIVTDYFLADTELAKGRP